VTLQKVPEGYARVSAQEFIGPSGEHVSSYRFDRKGGGSFVLAIHRGEVVQDRIRKDLALSELESNQGRQLYQAQLELLNTRQLAWLFGADGAVLIASPTMSFQDLAAIASNVEVAQ
jgi:hypothetical protein